MVKILFFALIVFISFCACSTVKIKATTSMAQKEIAEIDKEREEKASEKCQIKILGFKEDEEDEKKLQAFAVAIVLFEEPSEISATWWSPKIKNGEKDFDLGLHMFLAKSINGTFIYMVVVDLQQIPLEQFILVVKYIEETTKNEFDHSIIVNTSKKDAEMMNE